MGIARENIKTIPRTNQGKKHDSSEPIIEVSWKNVLKEILGAPSDRTDSQRCWSDFASHLREQFPETQWFFIRQEDRELNESSMLQSIHQWLTKVIDTPEWPLPESAIISSEGEGKNRCWVVSFPRSAGPLPRSAISLTSLTMVPWGNEHLHGWKILNIKPYTVNKTGEA